MIAPMQAWRWDLFCRVIDNFGDVGVCWRLAAALAARGHAVRLWLDDASALDWLAPQGAPGVTVTAWGDPWPGVEPGDVVVEAFGCAPPPAFVALMARQAAAGRAPQWINLEYLSAEAYVARSHGLRSPQFSGPGAGLDKWFYYPGFTPATGGLLHDVAPGADDPAAARGWLLAQAWARAAGLRADQRLVLVFGYAGPALPALLPALATTGTVLLLPPGAASEQLLALPCPPGVQMLRIPYLAQRDFDRLLGATDLNWVRGEDSFVRAQLCAGPPMLWQIYPQHDGAHGPKLEAFLDRYLDGAPADLAQAVRRVFRAVNALAPPPTRWPDGPAWQKHQQRWRAHLRAQSDLCTRLQTFLADRFAGTRLK